MNTKTAIKEIKNFLKKNIGTEFYLEEIVYDILKLDITEQQLEEIERRLSKRKP